MSECPADARPGPRDCRPHVSMPPLRHDARCDLRMSGAMSSAARAFRRRRRGIATARAVRGCLALSLRQINGRWALALPHWTNGGSSSRSAGPRPPSRTARPARSSERQHRRRPREQRRRPPLPPVMRSSVPRTRRPRDEGDRLGTTGRSGGEPVRHQSRPDQRGLRRKRGVRERSRPGTAPPAATTTGADLPSTGPAGCDKQAEPDERGDDERGTDVVEPSEADLAIASRRQDVRVGLSLDDRPPAALRCGRADPSRERHRAREVQGGRRRDGDHRPLAVEAQRIPYVPASRWRPGSRRCCPHRRSPGPLAPAPASNAYAATSPRAGATGLAMSRGSRPRRVRGRRPAPRR